MLIVPSVWARHIENCAGAKWDRCGDEAPPFAGKAGLRAGKWVAGQLEIMLDPPLSSGLC